MGLCFLSHRNENIQSDLKLPSLFLIRFSALESIIKYKKGNIHDDSRLTVITKYYSNEHERRKKNQPIQFDGVRDLLAHAVIFFPHQNRYFFNFATAKANWRPISEH